MNRGAARLAELFPKHGDQTRIAKEIGTDQGVVSRWIRGARAPKPQQRARLEDLYGIGWRLWDEPVPTVSGAGAAAAAEDEPNGSAA